MNELTNVLTTLISYASNTQAYEYITYPIAMVFALLGWSVISFKAGGKLAPAFGIVLAVYFAFVAVCRIGEVTGIALIDLGTI